MTTLSEKVIEIDTVMSRMKTDWVASEPDSTDLLIYLHLYRGDQIVSAIQCPLDRDTALNAARIATFGMAADTLVTTFESWHSTHVKCPVTNEPWKQGEMAFVGQTYPMARELGWVDECLTTNGYDRDGNYAIVSRPYLIKDNEVTFGEAEIHSTDDNDFKGDGYMHDVFVDMMGEPTILDAMAEQVERSPAMAIVDSLVIEPQARSFHIDVAALRAIAEKDLLVSAVLIAGEDETIRQEMITERFGESPDEHITQ